MDQHRRHTEVSHLSTAAGFSPTSRFPNGFGKALSSCLRRSLGGFALCTCTTTQPTAPRTSGFGSRALLHLLTLSMIPKQSFATQTQSSHSPPSRSIFRVYSTRDGTLNWHLPHYDKEYLPKNISLWPARVLFGMPKVLWSHTWAACIFCLRAIIFQLEILQQLCRHALKGQRQKEQACERLGQRWRSLIVCRTYFVAPTSKRPSVDICGTINGQKTSTHRVSSISR